MGKEKYQKAILELFDKSPVVGFSSIKRIVKNRKNVKQYTKQLVKNLISQGKIKRLAKGYYTKHDNASLAVFCFQPAYLGLQDALSFYDLWEQETIPIIITSRKVRQGIRDVMGSNILVRRIDKKYMFGFDYQQDGDFFLPYSSREKTYLDLYYFRQKLSESVARKLKKSLNKVKVERYLARYQGRFRKGIKSF
jgi:predicted transcriptional regulator of viral defense system